MPRLLTVMKNLCECIRIAAILITPFMPESAEKILNMLNVPAEARGWEERGYRADENSAWTTTVGPVLFPRLDVEKELAALEELKAQAAKAALPALEIEPYAEENVDFDTFCKSDLRAVKVVDCKNVKKSDKLLQFTLDDGTGTPRQILSGIAKFYKPEDLIGKTLVAITNLPPRKIMSRESNGMLLSAIHTEKGEEKLNLIMVSDAIPAGAKLC
jgi:methionyl-tRNA synthetase